MNKTVKSIQKITFLLGNPKKKKETSNLENPKNSTPKKSQILESEKSVIQTITNDLHSTSCGVYYILELAEAPQILKIAFHTTPGDTFELY